MRGCGPDRRQIPPGETIAAWVIIAIVPHADVAHDDLCPCCKRGVLFTAFCPLAKVERNAGVASTCVRTCLERADRHLDLARV